MDSDDPPRGGGGRTPGEVIDIMSTIASRLGEVARAPEPARHEAGADQAPAYVPADTRADTFAAPAGIRSSAPPTPFTGGDVLAGPLRTLSDGLALFGRAINDAAAQHVQELAHHVDGLARRTAAAEATAEAAHAAVRDVPQRVQGLETVAADAAHQAREARVHLQEISRLLTESASRADRIDAAFVAHADRLARLETGAETAAARITGLAVANAALKRRATRLRTAAIVAFLCLAALAAWSFWPQVTRVASLFPGH